MVFDMGGCCKKERSESEHVMRGTDYEDRGGHLESIPSGKDFSEALRKSRIRRTMKVKMPDPDGENLQESSKSKDKDKEEGDDNKNAPPAPGAAAVEPRSRKIKPDGGTVPEPPQLIPSSQPPPPTPEEQQQFQQQPQDQQEHFQQNEFEQQDQQQQQQLPNQFHMAKDMGHQRHCINSIGVGGGVRVSAPFYHYHDDFPSPEVYVRDINSPMCHTHVVPYGGFPGMAAYPPHPGVFSAANSSPVPPIMYNHLDQHHRAGLRSCFDSAGGRECYQQQGGSRSCCSRQDYVGRITPWRPPAAAGRGGRRHQVGNWVRREDHCHGCVFQQTHATLASSVPNLCERHWTEEEAARCCKPEEQHKQPQQQQQLAARDMADDGSSRVNSRVQKIRAQFEQQSPLMPRETQLSPPPQSDVPSLPTERVNTDESVPKTQPVSPTTTNEAKEVPIISTVDAPVEKPNSVLQKSVVELAANTIPEKTKESPEAPSNREKVPGEEAPAVQPPTPAPRANELIAVQKEAQSTASPPGFYVPRILLQASMMHN